jgi:serine/threonine protein kinase
VGGDADMAPGEPAQLAGYQVEEQIGRGGMAIVYRAVDARLGRRVALKILAPEIASDDSFRQRFMRESMSAASVDHPNIIPVFAAGESEGVLFIAMRYVETGDVRTLIRRSGPLPVNRALSIVSQVASALDAAHEHGLVHRDVKPANILLADSADGRSDHAYLSDFGLSKQSLAPTGLTMAGHFLGTLDYVAPEQVEGHAVDGRADQYSLACTAMEMLTGNPPFERDQSMAVLWAKLSEPPPSVRQFRPELPAGVDAVFSKALSRRADDRYPTCQAFAAALRAACAMPGHPQTIASPAGPARPPTEFVQTAPAGGIAAPDAAPASYQVQQPGYPAGPSYGPPAGGGYSPAGAQSPPGGYGPAGGYSPAGGYGPAQPGTYKPSSYSQPERPAPRKHTGRTIAIVVLVLLFCGGLGGLGYKLLSGSKPQPQSQGAGQSSNPASSSPATSSSPASSSSPVTSPVVVARTPAQTVQAYFHAINAHQYHKAWELGGDSAGGTYSQFVAGYSGTAHDSVTILSTSGDVVTARLTAKQTDGTVKVFQGTYTVTNGVITGSHVVPVSSS